MELALGSLKEFQRGGHWWQGVKHFNMLDCVTDTDGIKLPSVTQSGMFKIGQYADYICLLYGANWGT